MVEEGQGVEAGDGLLDPLVPALVADLLAGRLAQLLVEGLALAELHVGELHVREQPAVHEEGGAEAGAEGDDGLEALALHDGRPLHVGVVGHPGRLADRLGEGAGQVEVGPGLEQPGSTSEPGPFVVTKCGALSTRP